MQIHGLALVQNRGVVDGSPTDKRAAVAGARMAVLCRRPPKGLKVDAALRHAADHETRGEFLGQCIGGVDFNNPYGRTVRAQDFRQLPGNSHNYHRANQDIIQRGEVSFEPMIHVSG